MIDEVKTKSVSTEVAKKKTFSSLTAPYSDAKKDYLYLRVIGIEAGESMRIINCRPNTVRVWRADDESFLQLESYLVENRDLYLEEAEAYFPLRLQKIRFGLAELASRINDWDKVGQSDKPYILRAIELLLKISPMRSSAGQQSYDELILRRIR